ncbi:hypothetical protein ACETAC_07845 [Aceticella autotrophica]|uniref:Dihydropteroate synthase n=1 Tax=Aceticella autotrophica TaxID=2755338 RepID=A0A975AUR0_9THEO|nr:hypothetical protein [Aceticella autotrophica]QSZ26796.1 hypothetical protein ACETAC_07845 [Aceticella autotrophica]
MESEILHIKNLRDAEEELKKLDINEVPIKLMASKAVFIVIKFKDVHPIAANIIKQAMLSIGGETAVEHGCLNLSIDRSDIIIMGTLKQYRRLISKLKMQKNIFKVNKIVEQLNEILKDFY